MVEFSQREKLIIQIMTYLIHPQFQQIQELDIKVKLIDGMLRASVDTYSLSFDELKDVILGIAKQQEDAIKEQMGKLSRG